MKPTVGRIVHYYPHPFMETAPPTFTPLAALVVSVGTNDDGVLEQRVGLHVFYPSSNRKGRGATSFEAWVAYSPVPKYGCWTWPPREGA